MASIAVAIVKKLLANTDDSSIMLVTPDATYISLNFSNANLHKIMPWCGSHAHAGPAAIIETFANVARHWENKDFTPQGVFGSEDGNVAVFGSMTHGARATGKTVTSPFAVWCKVDVEVGKVVFMQFMEDTLATSLSFEVGGENIYRADPAGVEVRFCLACHRIVGMRP